MAKRATTTARSCWQLGCEAGSIAVGVVVASNMAKSPLFGSDPFGSKKIRLPHCACMCSKSAPYAHMILTDVYFPYPCMCPLITMHMHSRLLGFTTTRDLSCLDRTHSTTTMRNLRIAKDSRKMNRMSCHMSSCLLGLTPE